MLLSGLGGGVADLVTLLRLFFPKAEVKYGRGSIQVAGNAACRYVDLFADIASCYSDVSRVYVEELCSMPPIWRIKFSRGGDMLELSFVGEKPLGLFYTYSSGFSVFSLRGAAFSRPSETLQYLKWVLENIFEKLPHNAKDIVKQVIALCEVASRHNLYFIYNLPFLRPASVGYWLELERYPCLARQLNRLNIADSVAVCSAALYNALTDLNIRFYLLCRELKTLLDLVGKFLEQFHFYCSIVLEDSMSILMLVDPEDYIAVKISVMLTFTTISNTEIVIAPKILFKPLDKIDEVKRTITKIHEDIRLIVEYPRDTPKEELKEYIPTELLDYIELSR